MWEHIGAKCDCSCCAGACRRLVGSLALAGCVDIALIPPSSDGFILSFQCSAARLIVWENRGRTAETYVVFLPRPPFPRLFQLCRSFVTHSPWRADVLDNLTRRILLPRLSVTAYHALLPSHRLLSAPLHPRSRSTRHHPLPGTVCMVFLSFSHHAPCPVRRVSILCRSVFVEASAHSLRRAPFSRVACSDHHHISFLRGLYYSYAYYCRSSISHPDRPVALQASSLSASLALVRFFNINVLYLMVRESPTAGCAAIPTYYLLDLAVSIYSLT